MALESEFPTIEDARDVLQGLVDKGFGKLPVQVMVVPGSTLSAIAKDAGHSGDKPVLMLEFWPRDEAVGLGVLIASVDHMTGSSSGRLQ